MSRMLSNDVSINLNLAFGQLRSLDILWRWIDINFDRHIETCDKTTDLRSFAGSKEDPVLILIFFLIMLKC